MKGVINRGLQEFVEHRFGKETWESVRQAASCEHASFTPSLDYPDELTFSLLEQSAHRTGWPADEIGVAFGAFWIMHTGPATYPLLFALAGGSARDFLTRIHRIHQQVTASVPNAHPPNLRTSIRDDGSLQLRYSSKRALCPVVRGLIQGVGNRFGESFSIRETSCVREGAEECTFDVQFDEAH